MNLRSITLTVILLVFVVNLYAQNELNPYKYILVPKKFDFSKKEDQYRVNSYTKYLFDKEGYQVLFADADYPEDLRSDPCLALTANVINVSSAFTTKIFLVLENCSREEVFRSIEGRSKIKEFDKTYIDALKKCFVSVQELNYVYEPNSLTYESSKIEDSSAGNIVGATTAVTTVISPDKEAENDEITKMEAKSEATSVSMEKPEKTITPAAVVAIPTVAAKEEEVITKPEVEKVEEVIVARAFKNDMISFLLIDQGAQLQAFVSQSKNEKYKPGELIGTFIKSSLPKVYSVSWKKQEEGIEETTAYFDDLGNLKIDIYRDGLLETMTFVEIK